MTFERRMTPSEQATQLFIKQKIIAPKSKRGNVQNPEFRGASLEIQTLTDKYIAISGVARSGKSFAILYKLNQLALQNPGMRGLIVRKTRESLNESALVTFERDVLGEGNPIIPGGQRNSRHVYKYPNGSEIIVRGLLASGKDASSQVMSSEYDIIYVQEATEIKESEFGQLTTRLSNHRVPFQAIWLDCNPDSPNHWIWRYHLGGKIKLLHSYLKDNPKWWKIDPSKEDGGYWTKIGEDVYNTLAGLNGVQRERLFEGRWVQATGLVFGDVFLDREGEEDSNITEKADYIPDAGDVYMAVDDGYAGEYDEQIGNFTATSHPRVFLLCQMRADGTLCVFWESYKVKTLPEVHIKEITSLPYPEAYRIVVDKSAVDIQDRLREFYGNNVSNQKIVNVEEGIKVLRSFIAKDENGVRRLLIHPRCKYLRSEFSSYKRDDKENIIKEYDHGCLVAGTKIETIDGEKNIEDIPIGDYVLTRNGYRKVLCSEMTNANSDVYRILFSNGNELVGTKDHPVFVREKGFLPIDALRYGDIIEETPYRRAKCQRKRESGLTELFSMGLSTEDTQTRKTLQTETTTDQEVRTFQGVSGIFIKTFGSLLTEKFHADARYTTPTGIHLITTSKTLSALRKSNMPKFTEMNQNPKGGLKDKGFLSEKPSMRQLSGVTQKKGRNSEKKQGRKIQNFSRIYLRKENTLATLVEKNTPSGNPQKKGIPDSAQTTANQNGVETVMLTTSTKHANGAEKLSGQTNTEKKNSAPVTVVEVVALKNKAPVYNISVEEDREYYANGVLVHNCDALRYLCSVISTTPKPNFRTLG